VPVCVNDIWEQFNKPLKKFIRKRVNNDQDTDDIFQEVFIRIHNNIGSLKDDSKINAWIYNIARNVIIDYYRKHEKSIKLVEIYEDLIIEKDDELSLNSEIANCLKPMIDTLPEKYKQAIILTEFENLTQKELSKSMGLSLSGAKSRVQRARKKLKEIILDCCSLEFDNLGNIINYEHKSADCKYCK
jgi:RNA polymerase sigma-70 factor (ECF subfamily)